MATFTYKAKDPTGNTVGGSIDAPDSRAAAGKIREMGYFPLDIRLRSGEVGGERKPRGLSPSIFAGASVRSLTVFFRQLATMLSAGMTLSEALDGLARQRGMGRLPMIAASAAEHVRAGGSFSEVLARHPRVFSGMQTGLVRAGETGGRLDSMIDRVATYLERELALRQRFARVTFYPKLLIVAIIVIPQVPAFVLGGWPAVIMFLRHIVLPLCILVTFLYVAIKLLLTIPAARLGWDHFKLGVPVLGNVVRKLAMARFSTAFSVMYSAGMPMSQALETSSEAMANEPLRRAVLQAVPELQAGGQLSEALQRTGRVPDLVLGMLSTGERTGNMDQVLDKVAEYYEDEAATTLEKSAYLLFVLLILGCGAVVAFVVLGGLLGYVHGLGL